MIQQQQTLILSPYLELYNLVIPKDNRLRQINELIDFSFVYDELKVNYCLDPAKNTSDVLEDEIAYCPKLIEVVEAEGGVCALPKIKEPLNLLKETVADDLEQLRISEDQDAMVGHKSADSSFFGYKTHIAMTEERIITAAVVTTGEKNDGNQLQPLIEKSKQAGLEVKTVIGDSAYSEKDNIAYAKENTIELIAKLNPSVTQGYRKQEDEFQFNKDAGMYVCKAGHMAIRKARQGKKGIGTNQTDTYYFDVEKCKRCPLREGCYKEGAKKQVLFGEHQVKRAYRTDGVSGK